MIHQHLIDRLEHQGKDIKLTDEEAKQIQEV
jgi:hypothetical protein